ncbi:MAG: hypothetical protein QME64_13300, partial [bacterium]|nr:hypothetical protein [bacterium]
MIQGSKYSIRNNLYQAVCYSISILVGIFLCITLSYAVAGSIPLNPNQKTAFRSIKSDEKSIIILFHPLINPENPSLPYQTYVAVPLQGQPEVSVAGYLCQVWNKTCPDKIGDSIVRTVRNDTTLITPAELTQLVRLDEPQFIRDLRVARLTVKPIFDSGTEKKVYSELTIAISLRVDSAMQSTSSAGFIPTADTTVRLIGLEKVLNDIVVNYASSFNFRGKPALLIGESGDSPYSVDDERPWAVFTATQPSLYKISYPE